MLFVLEKNLNKSEFKNREREKNMGESVAIAIQVYLIAFVVAIVIAFLIKGMLALIRRLTPKKKLVEEPKKRSEVST